MNVGLISCDDQTIRERVQAAGVVGAGGAGFPTHIKLQARVDTFLVNAAECEPMLKVDQQLMAQQASRLLRGVHYAMKATGGQQRNHRAEREISTGNKRTHTTVTTGYPPAYFARCLPRRRRSADHLDGNWSPRSTRCITR
ncbi:propanediol utilization protein PduS [Escherichia coli]|nr:propanediol utilization protein PduS [Escherichia coli]